MNPDRIVMTDQLSQDTLSTIIIALLESLGGELRVSTVQMDKLAAEYLWGWKLELPNAPTGELKIDARVDGHVVFSLRRRQ